jgi:hypothetical protein
VGGGEAVAEACARRHELGAQAALGLEPGLGGGGGRPGPGLLGAGEVGGQGGVQPVGLVAREGGLGVALDGEGLEHADGVAGTVGGGGGRPARGAGGFEAEMERPKRSRPGEEAGVAPGRVGDGEGARRRGEEEAGVELVLGHVEAEDVRGGGHGLGGFGRLASVARGRPSW